jgi:hypothetical protein
MITKPMSVVISCALVLSAYAGDTRKGRCSERDDNTNFIIRRQQDYSVQGTPTSRIYTHGRKIDVYRDGTMFERDHVVGRSR